MCTHTQLKVSTASWSIGNHDVTTHGRHQGLNHSQANATPGVGACKGITTTDKTLKNLITLINRYTWAMVAHMKDNLARRTRQTKLDWRIRGRIFTGVFNQIAEALNQPICIADRLDGRCRLLPAEPFSQLT